MIFLNDNIIGYKNVLEKGIDIYVKCDKCQGRSKKIIENKGVYIVSCKECKNKTVIVILEFNNEAKEIVEYKVLTYKEYKEIVKIIKRENRKNLKNIDLDNEVVKRIKGQ